MVVSYYALWHFLQHRGITFKKTHPSRIVPTSEGGVSAGRRINISSIRRACLHRRDLGQNQHDASSWTVRQRPASPRPGTVRAMAYADLPWRHCARRPHRRAVRCRRPDQRHKLAYVEANPRADTQARRHRHHGQSRQSTKVNAVRRAIRCRGRQKPFFLPPYSPDLNPIEKLFAKLKALLRKAGERTVEDTWRRIGQLLDAFAPTECANYLKNAGYASV